MPIVILSLKCSPVYHGVKAMSDQSTTVSLKSLYRIMSQLRPQYASADEFSEKINQQIKNGYQLCAIQEGDDLVCAAGFRFANSLAHGAHIFIEDLVTDENARGKGYAKQLLDGIIKIANEKKINSIVLDSGVQRYNAHKFYIKNNFTIRAFVFTLALPQPETNKDPLSLYQKSSQLLMVSAENKIEEGKAEASITHF